jgi:hypothetical protein
MLDERGKITGTFIDEITWDIATLNWGADDWKRSFEAMSFIGIDTVVIIRGGLRDQAVFPSKVVGNTNDFDLAKLFLDEAAKYNMRLFFGTYESLGWLSGKDEAIKDEISVNLRFVDEVIERYCGHPALKGWYITQEVCKNQPGIRNLFMEMTNYLKGKTPDMPTLISPYYPGKMLPETVQLTPEQFRESWSEILDGLTGLIDIMAFQDGTAKDDEIEGFASEASRLSKEFGIEFWSNTETFDRTLSYHFPPRDIRVLRKRLEATQQHVSKTITFEFPHFMSPNSSFPGAANLYRRYCETVLGKKSPF